MSQTQRVSINEQNMHMFNETMYKGPFLSELPVQYMPNCQVQAERTFRASGL